MSTVPVHSAYRSRRYAGGHVAGAGEVVGIHIAETLLEEGIYQTAKAQPILRAGGPTAYYGISDENRFDMVRPGADQ